jgi:archaemetzincin
MGEPKLHINPGRWLALTLLPCGAVEPEELKDLTQALSERGMNVTVARGQPIPAKAFQARRQQYRADQFLMIARDEPGERVLVVTNCDLYADNLNFVFGMADSPGRCAVVSLMRLRIGADQGKFRGRTVKEAVHEIGHTFGLAHCADARCVMHFSNSLEDTDHKANRWCEECEKKILRDCGHAPLSHKDGGVSWLL